MRKALAAARESNDDDRTSYTRSWVGKAKGKIRNALRNRVIYYRNWNEI